MDSLAQGFSHTLHLDDNTKAAQTLGQPIGRSFSIKRKPVPTSIGHASNLAPSSELVQNAMPNAADASNQTESAQPTSDEREAGQQVRIGEADFKGQFNEADEPYHGSIFFDDGRIFKGCVTSGLNMKNGTLSHPGGRKEEGTWTEKDVQFEGTVTWKYGTVFKGVKRSGKVIGGTYTFPDGRTIKSVRCENGRIVEGIETLPTGDVFMGDFLNGDWTKGTLQYASGNIYMGTFEKVSLRREKGFMKYTDGSSFNGLWVNNKIAKGIRKRPIAGGFSTVDGEFDVEGRIKPWVKTTRVTPNARYVGTFNEDGQKHNGREESSDGTIFEGTFDAKGQYDKGTIWYPDGAQYHGKHIDGWKSQGVYKFADGDKFDGTFEKKQDNMWHVSLRHGRLLLGKIQCEWGRYEWIGA